APASRVPQQPTPRHECPATRSRVYLPIVTCIGMHNVRVDDGASDPRTESDARFPAFLERNDFCNRLTSERDDQGQTGGLDTFDQLDTPGFELGNQNFFHGLRIPNLLTKSM